MVRQYVSQHIADGETQYGNDETRAGQHAARRFAQQQTKGQHGCYREQRHAHEFLQQSRGAPPSGGFALAHREQTEYARQQPSEGIEDGAGPDIPDGCRRNVRREGVDLGMVGVEECGADAPYQWPQDKRGLDARCRFLFRSRFFL